MLFWGLIITKAKTGIAVAQTKDSEQVQASWKKIVKIVLIVAITSFVQTKYEPANQPNQI